MVSKELQDKFYAALESLKDGKNDSILEALSAGAKAAFEGVEYGYEWKFHTPGEEPLVSKFGTPDYSDNYVANDRLSYAKNLADKAKRFGEPNPRFGKTMTKTGKDGSYASLTPMRREWNDEYHRFGIPKAIRRRVEQLIAENGWDIVLDKSGYTYDKQNKRHNEIPEKYVWNSETTDPAVIEEITRTLAPLGFKHDTESHEAHYGFTGHGPIDTETFSVDVWKYTDKPVSPMVAEAVAKLGNAIGEMKTADNAPLVESIMEGFKSCFEAVGETQPMTMTIEHKIDAVADKSGDLKEQEVVYVQVNDHITVRITHDYCEYLEDGHIENGMGFPDDETHITPEQAMETAQQEKILNNF